MLAPWMRAGGALGQSASLSFPAVAVASGLGVAKPLSGCDSRYCGVLACRETARAVGQKVNELGDLLSRSHKRPSNVEQATRQATPAPLGTGSSPRSYRTNRSEEHTSELQSSKQL